MFNVSLLLKDLFFITAYGVFNNFEEQWLLQLVQQVHVHAIKQITLKSSRNLSLLYLELFFSYFRRKKL